ncbi:MAG: hypothetical protein H8K04_08000 [Nitrospira sp.]
MMTDRREERKRIEASAFPLHWIRDFCLVMGVLAIAVSALPTDSPAMTPIQTALNAEQANPDPKPSGPMPAPPTDPSPGPTDPTPKPSGPIPVPQPPVPTPNPSHPPPSSGHGSQ